MPPFLADVDLAFLTMGTNATIVFFVFQKKKLVFFYLRRIHFLLVNIMAWRATTVQDGSDARRMFFQLSGIRRFIILVIASGDLIL